MRKQRRADIARSLQLWATCGKQAMTDIDKRLERFVAEEQDVIESLKKAEDELKSLEVRKLQLTSSLLNSWFSMTDERTKTASDEHAADDLMFWNRLMHVSPETYEFLQPRWERFERLLVSARVREHNSMKKERSERVARLLCEKNDSESTRKQEGEDCGQENEKRET